MCTILKKQKDCSRTATWLAISHTIESIQSYMNKWLAGYHKCRLLCWGTVTWKVVKIFNWAQGIPVQWSEVVLWKMGILMESLSQFSVKSNHPHLIIEKDIWRFCVYELSNHIFMIKFSISLTCFWHKWSIFFYACVIFLQCLQCLQCL